MHLQPRHLIRHQRDQGRDHHRQRTRLVVARQGRDLIAERFTRARGQNTEHVLSRHRRLDDGLLHGAPVSSWRFRPEISEAEPAGELLAGIVVVPAPAAGGIGAGGIPEPANQPPRLGELIAHPGRHDRVAAGHRQPSQRVGQRPAGIRRLTHSLAGVSGAGGALQPARVSPRLPRRPKGGENGEARRRNR